MWQGFSSFVHFNNFVYMYGMVHVHIHVWYMCGVYFIREGDSHTLCVGMGLWDHSPLKVLSTMHSYSFDCYSHLVCKRRIQSHNFT